jgi:hypothetical protein
VPFVAGVDGLFGLHRGKKAEKSSLVAVFSLFLFNVLTVVYLLALVSGVF